jgi:hypothetical protein
MGWIGTKPLQGLRCNTPILSARVRLRGRRRRWDSGKNNRVARTGIRFTTLSPTSEATDSEHGTPMLIALLLSFEYEEMPRLQRVKRRSASSPTCKKKK